MSCYWHEQMSVISKQQVATNVVQSKMTRATEIWIQSFSEDISSTSLRRAWTRLNCTGTSRGTDEWCVPSIIYQTLEVQWFSSYSSARSGLTCLHGLCDWQWCNGRTEQHVCHVSRLSRLSRLYLATIIVFLFNVDFFWGGGEGGKALAYFTSGTAESHIANDTAALMWLSCDRLCHRLWDRILNINTIWFTFALLLGNIIARAQYKRSSNIPATDHIIMTLPYREHLVLHAGCIIYPCSLHHIFM